MRILVVSLLRLGDLLMAGPALAAIRSRHPRARIDVLVNRECDSLQALFSVVDNFIYFDRRNFQDSLTSSERPAFEAFYQLDQLVREIQSSEYDLLINLTQNKLGGYLAGAIQADQTIGLSRDTKGNWHFASNWFQYLNDRSEKRGEPMFHYTDIFSFGSCGESGWGRSFLKESPEGQREASIYPAKALAIQLFTSDEKKNWGLERWGEFLSTAGAQGVPIYEIPIVLLGASNEREAIESFVQTLAPLQLNLQVAIVSMAGAFSILKKARLLITGDTSIKHLAAAAQCPTIELALGGSDPWRTGTYLEDALILQPKTACAPCIHALPCGRSRQECALDLRPSFVAQVFAAEWGGRANEVNKLARLEESRVRTIRTLRSSSNYWLGFELGRASQLAPFQFWLDQLAHKMVLDGEPQDAIGSFGTEARKLFDWMRSHFPDLNHQAFQEVCQNLDREALARRRESQDAQERLRGLMIQSRDQSIVEIQELRKIQKFIESVDHRLGVRGRLIRSIQESAQEVM